MPTREIPRDKWVEFFKGFSHEHENWQVSLSVKGKDSTHKGGDTEVRKLPLRDISADVKDKEHTIVVTVGTTGAEKMGNEIEAESTGKETPTEDCIDPDLNIQRKGVSNINS